MKKKTTAALLAIFLGGFGVHKFYLRDTGSGIFYVMLTIFTASLGYPIGWILGWIDAFALLTMSEERFDKKYNQGSVGRQRGRRTTNRNERFDRRSTSRSNRNPYQKDNRRMGTNSAPASKNPYANRQRRNVKIDNPFKSSGKKYLKEFELDLAEVDLNRALELEPNDMDVHFDLGKLYSLEEKKDKAYYHLAKAMDLGFTDVAQFKTADELAYLRIQDEFEEFEASGYRIPPGNKSTTPTNVPTENSVVTPPKDDLLQDDLLLSQLNKLQELRKKGLLSENEFQEEKVKLMGR